MKDRQGVLWEAMEAAVAVLDLNREGARSDAAYNADVSPIIDLAKEIIERCAAVAEKKSGYVSEDKSFERGYEAGRQNAAEEIRALLSDEANRRKL